MQEKLVVKVNRRLIARLLRDFGILLIGIAIGMLL